MTRQAEVFGPDSGFHTTATGPRVRLEFGWFGRLDGPVTNGAVGDRGHHVGAGAERKTATMARWSDCTDGDCSVGARVSAGEVGVRP